MRRQILPGRWIQLSLVLANQIMFEKRQWLLGQKSVLLVRLLQQRLSRTFSFLTKMLHFLTLNFAVQKFLSAQYVLNLLCFPKTALLNEEKTLTKMKFKYIPSVML